MAVGAIGASGAAGAPGSPAAPAPNAASGALQAAESEPNDDFANATAIEPGTYEGLNVTEDDVDAYAVELDRGESLSAAIDFSNAEGDLDLFLLGPDRTVVQASTTEADAENISYVAGEAGTYYLVVVGFQGATGQYDLTVETTGDGSADAGDADGQDEFEPNDDFANATAIEPGTYEGLTVTEDDRDLFAVDLAAGESLSASIDFSHDEGDLDMLLFAPNGTAVQVSDSTTDGENVSTVAGEAGTYYLAVVGYQGATAPYDLTVSVGGDDDGTETGQPTGTPDNATTPDEEDTTTPDEESTPDDGSNASTDTPADPASDTTGWELGYWANESIAVDSSDGLTEEERAALLGRTMARVELVRDREFQRPVELEVMSREEYAEERGTNPIGRFVASAYYNQVYEATFTVDERTDAYDEVVGGSTNTTGGYYVPGTDRLVVITEDPDRPTVDRRVLVHELTHALQDQLGLFSSDIATTADARAARLGLVEGEATYVESRYESRCANGTWECELDEEEAANASDLDINLGVFLSGYQPYSDGPALVDALHDRGGWDAVEAAHDDPPVSTEQTIHPDRYPDERPAALEYEPDSTIEWDRFAEETLGEARIYSMFWYQDREYGIPVVDGSQIAEPESGAYDTYNYTSAPSEGWGNDRLYLYTNETDYGYVWVTTWDSEADARQFQDAYVRTLEGHGAEAVDETTWRIPEGNAYADAFRVVRDGTTVTVVNAPTEGQLSEIAPDVPGGNESGANESAGS